MPPAMIPPRVLEEAHKFCSLHWPDITRSNVCACFYCRRTFPPSAIVDWVDEPGGKTALCPYCAVDAVIGDASGYELTEAFLQAMYVRWFE